MSLLLKALKQAESANAAKPGSDRPGPDQRGSDRLNPDRFGADDAIEDRLELEDLPAPGTAQAREWIEPPDLIFGSSGLNPIPERKPPFRFPQLSLVPLTALLATLVAVGYGVYLYFALQPAAPTEPAVASLPSPAVPPSTVIPPMLPAMPAPIPDTPFAVAPPAPRAVEPVAAQAQPEPDLETRAEPMSRPQPPRSQTASRPTAPSSAAPMFQPDIYSTVLNQAYTAYQRGSLNEAQRLYTQAAARGRNVDALLGLAAIASAQKRDGDAQRLYREILDLDPLNATAQGALLDLLGNTDSQATESRLKMLIEREPSAHLYQTLGNLYADQKRWNDAQAAYFEAYRNAPDNADYAFNLAVSLDQLRQFPAARTYYEKALTGKGAHRFDRAQAEARVQQLKSVR